MPEPGQHPLDGVADDLLAWMNDEVDFYVDAIKGGYRAPFAAPAKEAEKLEFYRRQVFNPNPDGSPNFDSPNTMGRDTLLKRLGIQGYTKVLQAVMPKEGQPAPAGDEGDPLTGPDVPTDVIDEQR